MVFSCLFKKVFEATYSHTFCRTARKLSSATYFTGCRVICHWMHQALALVSVCRVGGGLFIIFSDSWSLTFEKRKKKNARYCGTLVALGIMFSVKLQYILEDIQQFCYAFDINLQILHFFFFFGESSKEQDWHLFCC